MSVSSFANSELLNKERKGAAMSFKSIMIVGVGGQGTLLASRLLGSALIESGFEVKVSEKNDEVVIEECNGSLAFDHVRIITDAIYFIRSGFDNAEYIFMLLPEKFSIPQMQSVYALVKGKSVSKEVVHRLYDKKIEKTMSSEQDGQHKRAILYRKKL